MFNSGKWYQSGYLWINLSISIIFLSYTSNSIYLSIFPLWVFLHLHYSLEGLSLIFLKNGFENSLYPFITILIFLQISHYLAVSGEVINFPKVIWNLKPIYYMLHFPIFFLQVGMWVETIIWLTTIFLGRILDKILSPEYVHCRGNEW